MEQYTTQEKVEIIFLYGLCDRSVRRTVREYVARFPNARHPLPARIKDIVARFQETGSVLSRKRPGHPRRVRDEDTEVDVIAYFNANPQSSIRAFATVSGISRSTIHRILSSVKFHPFHCHIHQSLHGNDFQRRLDFCNWLLNQLSENPKFLSKILFTDEATFSRDGCVNLHNAHYWAEINP